MSKESYVVREGNPAIDLVEMKLHNLAGEFLQSEMERNGGMMKDSVDQGFVWLKTEMTMPSFCNLAFLHGGNAFAVIPVPLIGMHFQISRSKKELLMENAEKYRLIPCLFPINVKREMPLVMEWNLFNLATKTFVKPPQLPVSEDEPMSVWEVRLLTINVILKELEKDGCSILSWQDVPEIQPQIWFRDTQGRESWIVICSDDDTRHAIASVAPHADRLRRYPGYMAQVSYMSPDMGAQQQCKRWWNIFSRSNSASRHMNFPKRQQGAFCNFRGLKEITPDMWR